MTDPVQPPQQPARQVRIRATLVTNMRLWDLRNFACWRRALRLIAYESTGDTDPVASVIELEVEPFDTSPKGVR